MTESLTITRPDDWHAHLRDGELMESVVGATARQFARAIVMPNLKPPIVTTKQAQAYRERIRAALPKKSAFEPLMTLYLTDDTPPAEIERARAAGFVKAVKYYPAGATTNSASGVTDIRKVEAVRLRAVGIRRVVVDIRRVVVGIRRVVVAGIRPVVVVVAAGGDADLGVCLADVKSPALIRTSRLPLERSAK